jgi:hypothetical protein
MSLRTRLSALLILAVPPIAIADTDVVVFDNGDRLTGEVRSLERGKLRFNTDATGTIEIEWDNVAFLSSDQNIQVETYDGRRYLGHLKLSPALKTINVQLGTEFIDLDATHVVVMTPIESKGLDRFDGDITAGYNFAKADGVEQLQFGLDMEYRTELRSYALTMSSSTSNTDVETADPDEDTSSQRHTINLNYKRFWPNRWLVSGFLNATRNDELNLDLRTSVGGGGGRILMQNDHSRLLMESGLMLSHENLAPEEGGIDEPDKDTVEAYVSLDWDWYRFDSPELDLSTSLEVIPNLTESDRIRGEFDISLKWEIIHDLFWEVSLYNSYDSNPVVDGAEQNDYGITTSIGYDF